MTYFKLDIPKVNESISRYKEIKKDCLEDINIVYRGLAYTESAWNDPNAYTFIEKTKRDKYKVTEYFDYLDRLYNEINQFKTDIDNICNKQGYRRNSITLKFDDSDIDTCKRYLNNAISLLNDSLNRINISAFNPDFEYIGLVYGLRSEIKSIKSSINELIQDINSFVNSVNNEIYDSKFRLKRIGNFDFNLKTTDYRWKVTNIDTKTINKVNLENYSNVTGTKIENNVQDSKLSKNMTSYSTKANEIDIEKVKRVDGLNSNLFDSFAKQKDIELKDNKKVNGLNNNINATYSNQNNINLDDNGLVKGLNNNVNVSTINNTNINTDVFGEIKGLNDNINQNNVNQNTISFESVKDINNLDSNIESAKVNNNSINYNIDNTVDIANNINSAEVKQTRIDAGNIVSNNYDLGSGIDIAEVKSTGIMTDINKNVNLDVNIKKMESLDDK